MITLNYSPTQKVFYYVLEYASITFLQKLYQVHIGISTKHNYLGIIQLDLTRSCFCSQVDVSGTSYLPPCFSQGDLDVCINHGVLFSFGYVSGLWTSTIYSLIASFSVTSAINDFCVVHLV